jgi:hypothetical protein
METPITQAMYFCVRYGDTSIIYPIFLIEQQ